MTAHIAELESVIRRALTAFAADLGSCEWRGKENDCVNRFAHGFLLAHCRESSWLRHPTQIGIEVGVAQPPGVATKAAARKDLVIWPKPWMSCWDSSWRPVNQPAAIMEWKVVRGPATGRGTAHDHRWLAAFANWQPDCVGFSVVLAAHRAPEERLLVTRFRAGDVEDPWLRL